MSIKPVLCLTFAIFSLLLACKSKCDKGYDYEDGACICPEGRYEIEDSCVALANNQFIWDRNCPCITDKVRVKFVPTDLLGIPILWVQVQTGNSVTSVYNLVEGTTLDSVSTGSNLAGTYCNIDGKDCVATLRGRLVHPDTIRGEVLYLWSQDESVVVQRCPAVLWK